MIALALLAALPLVARRHPLLLLGVAEAADVLSLAFGPLNHTAIGLGMAVALYTVATRSDRRTSLPLAGLIACVNAVVLLIDGRVFARSGSGITLFALSAVAMGNWSLGENVRTWRAYLAHLEERARRLELERGGECASPGLAACRGEPYHLSYVVVSGRRGDQKPQHINHSDRLLGLHDRVQAVVFAYESGFVTPGQG